MAVYNGKVLVLSSPKNVTINDTIRQIGKALISKGVATEDTPADEYAYIIDGITSLKSLFDITKSSASMFGSMSQEKGFPSIIDISSLINYNDTENVTDMHNMFNTDLGITSGYYSSLKQVGIIKIPPLDTHNVENMSGMFVNLKEIETIPQLDTSNVTNMAYMFCQCYKLKTIPQLDTSNVTNMTYMFYKCILLESLPQLDTSNVTDMTNMFYNCSSLSGSLTFNIEKLTRFYSTFEKCGELTEIHLENANKITSLNTTFSFCSSITTIETINAIRVTDMSGAFSYCTNLTNLIIKNIKVNLQVGSGTSWGHLLTLDSLINTCKECINVNANRTLTVGTANLAKLANIYVKFVDSEQTSIPYVATSNYDEEACALAKGAVEICESTDDGAMTIQEYMALKKWSLA